MEEETGPSKNVLKALKVYGKKIGRVLDIGAGGGEDSIFLSKKGFNVSALDSSKGAIHNIGQKSKIEGTKVKTIFADITKTELDGKYNIIICNNVLHFLNEGEAKEVIEKIKRYTEGGGINVLSYFFKGEETLRKAYSDWKILYFEEAIKEKKNYAEIVAVKSL